MIPRIDPFVRSLLEGCGLAASACPPSDSTRVATALTVQSPYCRQVVSDLPDWASIAGAVLGLAGLGAAYYFWRRPRKPARRLTWTTSASTVIEPQYPDIEVRVGGTKVSRVTLTRIVLYNAGQAALRTVDFAPDDPPVRIALVGSPDPHILRLVDVRASAKYTRLEVAHSDTEVLVRFSLIEPGDAIEVGLLHTGSTDAAVEVEARVIEGKVAHSTSAGAPVRSQVSRLLATVTAVGIVATLGAISSAVAVATSLNDQSPRRPTVERFERGCAVRTVFAQGRWQPLGAVVRAAPRPNADVVDAVGPNEVLAVDGWVVGAVPYPHNPAPWNSAIWFHLADETGWVSFASVRATPTDNTSATPISGEQSTTPAEQGDPAEASPDCQGRLRK